MKYAVRTIFASLVGIFAIVMSSCQKKDTYLECSHSEITFSYMGGTSKVLVESNGPWHIEGISSSEEISVSPLKGNGSGYVTVSVKPNNEAAPRRYAFLIILNGHPNLMHEVHVTQDANPSAEEHFEPGLYVAVTGFNNTLTKFNPEKGHFYSIAKYYNEISTFVKTSLKTDDGTILYYAVEDAIAQLSDATFPDDLANVSIVTFTDGLDQGSSAMNPDYNSALEYLSAINGSLRSSTVGGRNITAYTIGLKGNDVKDEVQFRKNLTDLATSEANATEVSNISDVNEKFQELASSLYQENVSQSFTLTIPQPYNGTKIRFTFDVDSNGDADTSEYYIEGVYNDGYFTNVVYAGMSREGADTVQGERGSGVNISFEFTGLQFEQGFDPVVSGINQWDLIASSGQWQINSEFNPDRFVDKSVKRLSAVVVLLLDCSSSLGGDFSNIKESAESFLHALYLAYNE